MILSEFKFKSMQTSRYEGMKITNGSSQKVNDSLVVEAALQINVNNNPYTVIMRTPGDDSELIRGLFYAEDIYKKKAYNLFVCF